MTSWRPEFNDHEGNPLGTPMILHVHPGCSVEIVRGEPAVWDDDAGYLRYSRTEALRLALGLLASVLRRR